MKKYGFDLFKVNGKIYLIVVDYFSNSFKINILTKITIKQIIHCVKHFACYGIPKIIVSDCKSQFISPDSSVFCKKWHITHITSSPGHQQDNGRPKAAVKAPKHLLKTCRVIKPALCARTVLITRHLPA